MEGIDKISAEWINETAIVVRGCKRDLDAACECADKLVFEKTMGLLWTFSEFYHEHFDELVLEIIFI